MGGQGPAIASPKKNWSGTLDPRLAVVRIGAVIVGLRQVPSKSYTIGLPAEVHRQTARAIGWQQFAALGVATGMSKSAG